MASSVPTVSKTDDGSGGPLTSPAAADGAHVPPPPSCKLDTFRCIKRGQNRRRTETDRQRQTGSASLELQAAVQDQEKKIRRSQFYCRENVRFFLFYFFFLGSFGASVEFGWRFLSSNFLSITSNTMLFMELAEPQH